jgi:hypothetical protein
MTTTTMHEPRTPAAGGWFKSSWSGAAGECVEINFDHRDGMVRIRDSKNRGEGPMISPTLRYLFGTRGFPRISPGPSGRGVRAGGFGLGEGRSDHAPGFGSVSVTSPRWHSALRVSVM